MNAFILPKNDQEGRTRIAANACAFINRLPESQAWEISVRPYRKSRSDRQNAGLFAVAYPPIMEFCGLRGDADKKELHRNMCGEYFGWVDCNLVRKPVRTTTTNEHGQRDVVPWDMFSDFYAFVQQQGASLGVYVPDPDPLWKEGPLQGHSGVSER